MSSEPGQPVIYQIRIKGQLDPEWTDWFEGLTITLEGERRYSAFRPGNRPGLCYGLLKKLRDLGLPKSPSVLLNPILRLSSGQTRQMCRMPDHKLAQDVFMQKRIVKRGDKNGLIKKVYDFGLPLISITKGN